MEEEKKKREREREKRSGKERLSFGATRRIEAYVGSVDLRSMIRFSTL